MQGWDPVLWYWVEYPVLYRKAVLRQGSSETEETSHVVPLGVGTEWSLERRQCKFRGSTSEGIYIHNDKALVILPRIQLTRHRAKLRNATAQGQ